jgi:endonuclease/exonuclease/phosphatase (EEP) superfamily protein YafD
MSTALVSAAAHAGSWWWPLDVIANFRPQLGITLLVFGLLLAAGRWRRTARVVLVVALVDVALVAWLWVPAGPDVDPAGERYRILSLNLLAANESYDEVMDLIEVESPDLVLLHEASLPWEEAAAGSGLPYEVVRTRGDDHIFGTLVMVRGEARVEGFGFTEREPRSVEIVAGLPSGATLNILGVHPLAPDAESTSGLRDAQLDFAAGWAIAQRGPTVVVGDLNAGPWSHAFRSLVGRDTRLRDSQRGFGLQLSFPATRPAPIRVAIDHALVSDEIAVIDRRLGPSVGSDHYALIVDLGVPGGG